MGLFGSNKKTMVSSVVYNMAGEEKDRPNFLRTTVAGSILQQSGQSMGQAISRSYLNGPGLRLLKFAQWADSNGYNNTLGLSTGSLRGGGTIDLLALSQALTDNTGRTVNVTEAEIGDADYSFWAERWILANKPNSIDTEWTCSYDSATGSLSITFVDGMVTSFLLTDYNALADYLYVTLLRVAKDVYGPVVVGPTVAMEVDTEFPSNLGWTRAVYNMVTTPITLNNQTVTTVTYSDGRPAEVTTVASPVTVTYDEGNATYTKTQYFGESESGSDRIYSVKSDQYRTQALQVEYRTIESSRSSLLQSGVTITTTKVQTVGIVHLVRSYRTDTQEIVHAEWSAPEMQIYKENSGTPALDAFFNNAAWTGKFYPFIPVRLNNSFISGSNRADIYALNKKAYKKSTGSKYDKLIDSISENASLGDIDHAFCVYGVSLNTKENVGRQYLYAFFKQLLTSTPGSSNAYDKWKADLAIAVAARERWVAWKNKQANDGDSRDSGLRRKTKEPPLLPIPVLPKFSLRIASANSWTNYNTLIKWNSIKETVGNGLGRVGAKKGDAWVVAEASVTYQINQVSRREESNKLRSMLFTRTLPVISLYFQDTDTSWRRLQIVGLHHTNIVYRGHAVETPANEALADTEESGFIVPLQETLFRGLGIREYSQLATSCNYLVFNCYKVVKKKWYQTGLFQVVLIIAIIVVSIFFPPAGSAAGGAGVLGTNATVGASLGFAVGSTTAIIVGAVANGLAAMILTKVITTASKELFGDKVGAIVGTIASVMAMQVGSAMSSGQSMAQAFNNLSQAQNLLKLTLATMDGVSQYIQAGIQDTIQETAKLMQDYEQAATKIANAYSENLGSTGISLDPLRLTEATIAFAQEAPDNFFSRTLMTGSDIARTTHSLVENFTALTLNLDLQT